MRSAVTQLLLAGVVAGACSSGPAAPARSGTAVVSLHDVTTEILVDLDARDRLVGIAPPVALDDDHRSPVAKTERVGSLESILAREPDLVVGLGVVAERNPELIAGLRRHDVPVKLWDPRTLADVARLVEALGAIVDRRAAGERLAGAIRERGRPVPVEGSRPRVFVYDCCDPPFTAGGGALLHDLVRRAGGANVFADLDADWTHVSWEEVVARQPELVVVHAYAFEGQRDTAGKRARLDDLPALADVPTVVVPLGASLGGPRATEALDILRGALDGDASSGPRGRGRPPHLHLNGDAVVRCDDREVDRRAGKESRRSRAGCPSRRLDAASPASGPRGRGRPPHLHLQEVR